MPLRITRQQMIDDICTVAKEIGRPPLITEYDKTGKYSPPPIRTEFGSWREAILACGLKPTELHRKLFSDNEINSEYSRLEVLLGHSPSWTEIRRESIVSVDTFDRRKGRSNFSVKNPPLSPNWSLDKIDPEIGGWISGLVTGEGSFIIRKDGQLNFGVGLRADDQEILVFVKSVMDIPYPITIGSNAIRRSRGERVGDEARLWCHNRYTLRERVIPFFTRFPLRGRKALDFALFKEAVDCLSKHDSDESRYRSRFTPQEKEYLAELSASLKALRFDPTSCIVT